MKSVQPEDAGTTEADIVIRNILAAQREKREKAEESGDVTSHYAQPQSKPKSKLSTRSQHISSKLREVISNASLRIRNSVRRSNRRGSKWSVAISPSPSSRRKKRGGLRLKESVRKPPTDMNSLFEAPQPLSAYMMENQKKRQLHRQKHVTTAVSSISLLFLAVGTLIGTYGWLRLHLLHWEYTALLAAMNEASTPWIEDCPNRQLLRTINGINYTAPCRGVVSIDKARWSEWTDCDRGIRYRWKILDANVSYDVEDDRQVFQEQGCGSTSSSSASTTMVSTVATSSETTTITTTSDP